MATQDIPIYGSQAQGGGLNVFNPNTGAPLAGAGAFNPNTGLAIPTQQPPISANNVGNANALNIPAGDTSATTDLATIGNKAIQGATSDIATQQQALSQPKSNSKTDIASYLGGLIPQVNQEGAKTLQYQQDQGLEAKQKLANDLTNQINTTSRAYENQIRDAQTNTQGKFGNAVEQDVGALNIKKNQELADLAIQKSVALGDLQTAQNIIDSKIKAEFEPLKNQIKYYEDLYNLVGNDLTDSEKMALSYQYDIKKMDYADKLKNAQSDALQKYGVTNSNDPSQLVANLFNQYPKLKTNQDINNAAAVVSSINELSSANPTGKIKGYGVLSGGFLPEFLSGQKAISTREQVSAIDGKVQQWLSGAALSKAQEKLVKNLIPSANDTDATVQTKLNGLANYMLSDIKGRVSTQGATFDYTPVDLWSSKSSQGVTDIQTSTVKAIASGYEPSQVVEFIAQNYPDKATAIQQARDQGYSDEDIITFLSTQ